MRFDAMVIGSGQGGNPLAHRLADDGKTVALIEEKELGGTCINTGCTPTKTMVASAQVAHYARNSSRWGVRSEGVAVDLAAVRARKDEVVRSFRAGQQKRVDDRKTLRLFRGKARFMGPHEVRVNNETLESERIFIDTGAHPSIPEIPGLSSVDYLTNVSIMELDELPKHLVVLGGGYVGLEFGQMFRRFGSDVTVIHRSGQILPREDEDVAGELQKCLESEGIRFRLNAKVSRVEKGIHVHVDSGEKVSGSHLLVATGRAPNTQDLDLAKAGVEIDKAGYVKVNHRLETNVPGIWALGDVKGGPAFTHISYNDYQIIYANLFEGKNLSTEGRLVPYAVFTDPQLGRIGITEREAKTQNRRLKIGKVPMSYVARAIERSETAGFMKLLVDAESDQILGVSILGTEGGELVQTLGLLMLANVPYTKLKEAIYIHPTLTEGFFSLIAALE